MCTTRRVGEEYTIDVSRESTLNLLIFHKSFYLIYHQRKCAIMNSKMMEDSKSLYKL